MIDATHVLKYTDGIETIVSSRSMGAAYYHSYQDGVEANRQIVQQEVGFALAKYLLEHPGTFVACLEMSEDHDQENRPPFSISLTCRAYLRPCQIEDARRW